MDNLCRGYFLFVFLPFFFFFVEITSLIVQSRIILYVYGNWTLFSILHPFSYESKILLLNRFLFPFDVIKPFERTYTQLTIITKIILSLIA